jgi:silicon transporter
MQTAFQGLCVVKSRTDTSVLIVHKICLHIFSHRHKSRVYCGQVNQSPVDIMDPGTFFKNSYSVILLIFSLTIVLGLIFTEQTKISNEVHIGVALVCMVCSVTWLTMIEGGQASLVGLSVVDTELFKDSHPTTYKICKMCHTGDNLDRYLLGRQFMVVLVVFIINMSSAPIKGAELWGFPNVVTNAFLVSGLAMILFTCMLGQLHPQVNASHCMLDYINNYFMLGTFYVAMTIEFTGLLHASYLVEMFVNLCAGKKAIPETTEPPRDFVQNVFFWGRCLMSLGILAFSMAVTLKALFDGKTTMWEGVPPAAAVVIFFALMSLVGMLEGMQIAFFGVAKLTAEERGSSVFAKKTCELLYKGDGHNLPGFMIGRQLMVVSCMFFIARVTSVEINDGESNIFGLGQAAQKIFTTGLCGSLVLTIIGSIAWQLVAATFPIAFLSNPLTYVLLRLALAIESTGLCNGAWVIAGVHAKIAGFQRDEVYIGTAEERAARKHADQYDKLPLGPGHKIKLPGFAENAPPSLRKLFEQDPKVLEYVQSIHRMETGSVVVNTEHGHETDSE